MSYSERHYGNGDPDCPICGGLGYIRYDVPDDHPAFGEVFDCECREAKLRQSRVEYLRRLGGLAHLADKTFERFDPDGIGLPAKQRDNLRRAYERAAAYAQDPEGLFILTGGYGCGKTHLAAAIAHYRIEQGDKVLFVTAPDLLDHLRTGFGVLDDDTEDYNTRFEEVRDVALLVLDDLGIESPTPWATEKLYQLINYRYNAKLPTVITTNFALEDLELRVRSRLTDPDVAQTVAITAPDYRRGGVEADTSDFNSLRLHSHMTFDTFDLRQDLPREQREDLREKLRIVASFAQSLADAEVPYQERETWLVIMGDYGSGKTHLAAAVANDFHERGGDAIFIGVPDLLDHLRAAFSPESHTSYDKRFTQIKSAPLLVLDDLGTESATPWAREKLYQLFNYRYTTRLPTIITTPHNLEDLDPRLVTRMRDKRICKIIALKAPAYLGERPGQTRSSSYYGGGYGGYPNDYPGYGDE